MIRAVTLFWAAVFMFLFLGAAFWIADRVEICVSSMMVEVGQAPVVNPVTCQ